jgi:ferredoxin-NADP reductase
MIQENASQAPSNRIRASVKIIEKKEIAEGTLGLYLEKPNGFTYCAGQYVLLHVPQLSEKGGREATHPMSLASAPYQDYLLISMRVSQSDFKQTINNMAVGEELVVDGPIGNFILNNDNHPIVFLAGGIGIAPFLGMILDQQNNGWPRPITLFYGNKTPQNTAFLELLRGIKSDKFLFIPTMSQLSDDDKTWAGERGRITASMVSKYVKDVMVPIYYIVGLPEMVKATKEEMLKLGVKSENIKIEFFTGYTK